MQLWGASVAKPLWTIWDHFGAKDKTYAREKIVRPTHFNEFRCRDRVRDVAALAAEASGAPSAAAVASDLNRRTTYWLDRFESGVDGVPPIEIRPRWIRNILIGALVVFPLAVMMIWVLSIDHPILLAVIMFAPLGGIAAWPLLQEAGRATQQFTARFRARQCPDCGHDISQIPPAIDPETLHGQWVGPAACPKCGVPWPMVPPPVPATETRT
jgi:hypothetical protein